MKNGLMMAVFTVMLFGFSFASTMEDANSINVTSQSGFGVNDTHSNITTEGGNVSEVNLDIASSTLEWAGFMGNVTADLVLAQSGDTSFLYNWSWAGGTGTVCASTNSAFPWASVASATAADIATAWTDLATGVDSAANTFTIASGTQYVTVNGVDETGDAADTNGNYFTVVLGNGAVSVQDDLVFCVNMSSSTNYRNDSVNYEMIVPTDYANGTTTETYFFYLELI